MKYLKVLVCLVAAVFVMSWTGISKAEDIVLGYTGPLSGLMIHLPLLSERHPIL